MDTMEPIGTIVPTVDTQAGRALVSGELMVTVTSRASQAHVSLRIRPSQHGDDTCGWADATHVAIEELDGARLATYMPATGEIAWRPAIGAAQMWTVRAVLRYIAGEFPDIDRVAEVVCTTLDDQLDIAA